MPAYDCAYCVINSKIVLVCKILVIRVKIITSAIFFSQLRCASELFALSFLPLILFPPHLAHDLHLLDGDLLLERVGHPLGVALAIQSAGLVATLGAQVRRIRRCAQ